MKTSGARLLCSFALALSACGSAASYKYELPPAEEQRPTLATIRGKTEGEVADVDPARLRASLVWFPVSPAPGKAQIAQKVKHQDFLNNLFEINISEEPLPAVIEGAGMMRYAQAEVVLYEDVNDNNELDLVSPGTARIDRVVGRATGVRVWWLGAGSPAPIEDRGYRPVSEGWSVTYGPIKDEPNIRDCKPDNQDGPGGTWRPSCPPSMVKAQAREVSVQNPFVITMSSDSKLQSYACRGFWGTSSEKSDEWSDKTPGWYSREVRDQICNPATCDCPKGAECELDLPVDPKVPITCNPDQTTYAWKACAPDPKLCNTVFCHEGKGARDPAQPKPKNWPTCSQ
jgi:hypothetical protein